MSSYENLFSESFRSTLCVLFVQDESSWCTDVLRYSSVKNKNKKPAVSCQRAHTPSLLAVTFLSCTTCRPAKAWSGVGGKCQVLTAWFGLKQVIEPQQHLASDSCPQVNCNPQNSAIIRSTLLTCFKLKIFPTTLKLK